MSNEWYKKGEFPPDYTKCLYIPSEIDDACAKFSGKEVLVIGKFICSDGDSGVVMEHITLGIKALLADPKEFVPIKSDREKTIEEMQEIWDTNANLRTRDIFGKIYDAGYRKVEK